MAKYSVQEFAELIKTEYPDYADMDDLELTQQIINKYPEYESQVDINIEVEETVEPEGDDKKKSKPNWRPFNDGRFIRRKT